MVDKDVVLEKVNQIQNCLKRIQEKTEGNPEKLEDLDVQEIFVLNLQRAIQACLDLAAHVIADEGLGLPAELRENFVLLEKKGIVDATLSERLQKMVGFRNIAVHDYSRIDTEILKSILVKNLRDMEAFYASILRHFSMVSS